MQKCTMQLLFHADFGVVFIYMPFYIAELCNNLNISLMSNINILCSFDQIQPYSYQTIWLSSETDNATSVSSG
jgi:hypothetical protein